MKQTFAVYFKSINFLMLVIRCYLLIGVECKQDCAHIQQLIEMLSFIVQDILNMPS